eukprot:314499-Prymnesium_polylepis.1
MINMTSLALFALTTTTVHPASGVARPAAHYRSASHYRSALHHRPAVRATGRHAALRASAADAFDPSAFFRRALDTLPENPETAELQLRSGLRAALDAGERRIAIDVRVPELDASSRGFVPQLLARFALATAQEAAVGTQPALALIHSLDASMQASLLARERAFGEGEVPTVVSLGPLAPPPEEIATHQARARTRPHGRRAPTPTADPRTQCTALHRA